MIKNNIELSILINVSNYNFTFFILLILFINTQLTPDILANPNIFYIFIIYINLKC